MTNGKVTPVIVTPVAALAFVIVTLAAPRLEMVTDCDAIVPRGTEPKLIEAGAMEIDAAPGVTG